MFLTYLENQARSVCRDRYFDDSLKGKTQNNNRGAGVRRKVTSNGLLPNNWATFLRCSENKTELFRFLTKHVISEASTDKLFVATYNDVVIVNQSIDTPDRMPCTIKEADERMFMPMMLQRSLMIKTVDSNVVIIAISAFHRIHGLSELWIEFGTGKSLKYESG